MTSLFQRVIQYIRRDGNLSSLLRGAGIMYAAGLLTIAFTFLQQITTAAQLGVEDYGRLTIILGSNFLILHLVNLRTWEITSKLATRYRNEIDTPMLASVISWYTLTDLVTGLAGTLITIILADFIAVSLMQSAQAVAEVRFFAVTIPLQMISAGTVTIILRLYNRYDWLSMKSVLTAVIRLMFMSGAAWMGLGLSGVVIGAVLAEVFGVLILLMLIRWLWRGQVSTEIPLMDFSRVRTLTDNLRLMRSMWLTSVLTAFQLYSFIPLMAMLMSPVQVGIYRAGFDVAYLITRLIEPISLVLQPNVIQIYEKGDLKAILRYLRQIVTVLGVMIVPFVIGLIVFSPMIEQRLLPEFENVAQVITLLAIGFGITSMFVWLRPMIVAMEFVMVHNIIILIASLMTVGGLLLAVPYGAVGAACVMLLVYIYNATAATAAIVYRFRIRHVVAREEL